MFVVVCYPFLDFRFLIANGNKPDWVHGNRATVGSLGRVITAVGSGKEAEIEASAALQFGIEAERRASGKPRRPASVTLDSGLCIDRRALLADTSGHVRVEVITDDSSDAALSLADRLEAILTTQVYVVRSSQTELISAGFDIAWAYLEQSAKTAPPLPGALSRSLVREGAGSPFLIVVDPDPDDATASGGEALAPVPALYHSVDWQCLDLAGRATGVWHLRGGGAMPQWLESVRMLCRIVCQLSEVTLLARLLQDDGALAPHVLDPDLVNQFFRVRAGQLTRRNQGGWSVPAVQAFAARHLDVAINEAFHSRASFDTFLHASVAGGISREIERIRGSLPVTGIAPPRSGAAMNFADRQRLVDILVRHVRRDPLYLQQIIQNAKLTDAFKLDRQQGWSNDPREDANALIDWAIAKGRNPANPRYTILASILVPALDLMDVQEAAAVAATIAAYDLVLDAGAGTELRRRYNVPELAAPQPTGAHADVGPDIAWHGPADDAELQSWFRPEPDLLDVAYLAGAIRSAASVCRVEVGATGTTGTGVMIAPGYVLTNDHVVAGLAAGSAELATVTLRFGRYEGSGESRSIGLDPAAGIIARSPSNLLDYALLKLAPEIAGFPGVRPATLSRPAPGLKAALSILQHPEGDDMKLAPSNDAVTFVDPATGIIQYVARTARGSSGAPCFDDQWRLIAIHHAERARSFGTIREGILIGPIMQQIEHLLT